MIEANKRKNIGVFTINGEEYDVFIAKSEKQKEKGLMYFTELPEDQGMLFVNDEEEPVSYWMKNTHIPLELIFMDEDFKVISVKHGKPESEEPITEVGVKYVLEVNPTEGKIKKGDEGDLEEPESNYVMKMLAPDGSTQFLLKGGERIYSRKSTKQFIRKALKAERTKEDKDYKALGKALFKELYAQDHRKAEYVDPPKSKDGED